MPDVQLDSSPLQSGCYSCLACGSQDGEPWAQAIDIEYCTTEKLFTYVRCRSCDCLGIDPVPADALREIYPSNYYSYGDYRASFAGRVKNALDQRFFRAFLRDVQGESLRILDVGGGAGDSLDAVRKVDSRVKDTVVVDLDDGAQRVAVSRGHEFFHGRIEDFESKAPFDVVVMLNLIEHLANPAEVLRKVSQILRPGGRIIIKTPNWRSWDHFMFRYKSWGGYHCPRHWVLWTMPGFREFAESCGLKVVSARYTQGAPFWAVSILNSMKSVGLVTITRNSPACSHPLFGPLCGMFALVDYLRAPFASRSQMFFVLTRNL